MILMTASDFFTDQSVSKNKKNGFSFFLFLKSSAHMAIPTLFCYNGSYD
ncbi:hypothetical protein P7266_0408 [Lactococcus cremoris]|nr:hypothetical protein P7266_0408 [Lactococcus cremoris]